jgi:hypothetical protein
MAPPRSRGEHCSSVAKKDFWKYRQADLIQVKYLRRCRKNKAPAARDGIIA